MACLLGGLGRARAAAAPRAVRPALARRRGFARATAPCLHGHGYDSAGDFSERERPLARPLEHRSFTVGIGGPVGSGKTALVRQLCLRFRDEYNIACVTNDIFTREDAEFLLRNEVLPEDRVEAVETGGCPHAAIREDVSANLAALELLTARHRTDFLLLESGGDNLAANFSRELADLTIYVIDVAGGDKVPRKGGPGVTQSDVFVINKTDLADIVGADLDVMARDAYAMRGDGPTVFAQVKNDVGVAEIAEQIVDAWQHHRDHADDGHGHSHGHGH